MKNQNINKVSSPRNVVGDLLLVGSYKIKEVVSYLINDKQKGDSGQRHPGMTALFNRRAFTLIELLVVVLIIGILAAIALPQYTKAVEKSRMAGALVRVAYLSHELDAYLLENGYPKYDTIYPITNFSEDLDCNDDDFCSDGYFTYHIACDDGGCSISVNAKGSQRGENEPYELQWTRGATDSVWEKNCEYFDDIGEYICKTFLKS